MAELKIEIEGQENHDRDGLIELKVKKTSHFYPKYKSSFRKKWRQFKSKRLGNYQEIKKLKNKEHLYSTAYFRIFKLGLQNFKRNGLLTVATVSVMILAIFSVLVTLMVSRIAESAIYTLNRKVDFVVEVLDGSNQDEVNDLVEDLRILPSTEQVSFVSKEAALSEFAERYQDLPQFLKDYELNNPLPAHIVILPKSPEQLPDIISFLKKPIYGRLIDNSLLASGNPQETRVQKLIKITNVAQSSVFLITLILGLVAILIIVNTIRLTIYGRQDEIFIMNMVGASRAFLKGPFLIEGILYGLCASFLSAYFFFFLLEGISGKLSMYFEQDLLSYYDQHFWRIFLGLLTLSAILGALSSMIATHKYIQKQNL
ncbi:MAG: permease-like cell division protein FtsX [Candidatus Gracilibacteria bacterium]|nr:permease-like cell division protein FtsX [Candidatus Gracilibacteria bacterium]